MSWTSVVPGGLRDLRADFFSEVFTATELYSVAHGLGRRPLVQVVDSDGELTLVAVDHTDENNLVLAFSGTLTDARVICIG